MPTPPTQMRIPLKLREKVDAEAKRRGVDRTTYTLQLYREDLRLDDNDEPRPMTPAERTAAFRQANARK